MIFIFLVSYIMMHPRLWIQTFGPHLSTKFLAKTPKNGHFWVFFWGRFKTDHRRALKTSRLDSPGFFTQVRLFSSLLAQFSFFFQCSPNRACNGYYNFEALFQMNQRPKRLGWGVKLSLERARFYSTSSSFSSPNWIVLKSFQYVLSRLQFFLHPTYMEFDIERTIANMIRLFETIRNSLLSPFWLFKINFDEDSFCFFLRFR